MRISFILFLGLIFSSFQSFGQVARTGTYSSDVDRNLTINRVGVLPVVDNTGGVYSRIIENQMREHVDKDHRFGLTELNYTGPILSPRALMDDPSLVQKVLGNSDSDAVLSAQVSKTQSELTINFALFTKSNGLAVATERLQEKARFESDQVSKLAADHVEKLFDKLPYAGVVMSRQNNRVTVNLGRRDGVTTDQIVSAILLISEERHPKFGFLVSTEKEVLGKIRIEKVEDTLSFGNIISEKTRGAIEKNTKIEKTDFVEYKGSGYLAANEDPNTPGYEKVTFGKNPNHWVPLNPPTFGRIGMALGMGSYTNNFDTTAEGPLQAQTNFFPQVRLDGELWVTPEFNVQAHLRQGVISVDNPRSGSEPESLNVSLSQYTLLMGYYILIHGDFFGPKVNLQGGFSSYQRFVDSSDPTALTSTTYSGFVFGVDGSLPVDQAEKFTLGANVLFFVAPSLSESPETGDSSDSNNSVNMFSLYGKYKWTERIRFRGSTDFEVYSTSFTGSSASFSERVITFNGGLEYFF